ncbi:thiopurine S-methyltransferase [Methylosarcina fibrata]|uniref:thiopurine S-methyltransferase n=1 Tax=Methylosarcina fibrata TaxID=105972 RepID=UPI000379336A|nr:thiopurine S-methyltransferase [Methylosarcina fibrata]
MEASFWHQKWAMGDIGFHDGRANALLVEHFGKLNPVRSSRIFLPLCGKTRDIAWLLASGYRVVGAELSELAVSELFKELGLEPEIVAAGAMAHYRAKDIDLFVGDVFDLSAQYLGPINAIYDRAALVALPADLRRKYAAHLVNLTEAAPQLLITYEYSQPLMQGPPFSVSEDELEQLYGAVYQLKLIERKDVEGGLKGKITSTEAAWLLQKSY